MAVKRQRQINWDSNVMDRLLHVVSPVILIAAALIMTATVVTVSEPKREVYCLFPKEFMPSMYAYGQSVCSSGLANYYIPSPSYNKSIPPTGFDIDGKYKTVKLPPIPEFFYETSYGYIKECLLLAMLCIVPFAAWSLVGKADDVGVLLLSHTSKASLTTNSVGSLAWYILTRIATVLVAVVCCVMFSAPGYTNLKLPTSPVTIFCDYWVRRMGGNMHRYSVQCIHSISNGDMSADKDMMWLRNVLYIWFIGLSVVLVLNAAFTIVVCLVSCFQGFRRKLLHRMVDVTPGRSDDIIISPHQAFVIVMAARNGYGQLVSETLKRQLDSLMSKQE